MEKDKKAKRFVEPVLVSRDRYQTASVEHCHQVKVNDCSFPMKA